jgi:DNA-binding NarL/FixJ family response regulator
MLSSKTDSVGASAPTESSRLTIRQIEVAKLVAKGVSNKQVAARFGITLNTVKNDIGTVYKTLQLDRYHVGSPRVALAMLLKDLESRNERLT